MCIDNNYRSFAAYSNSGGGQVVYIAHDGPAGHEHENVGQHVLLLRVPERVCKLPTILHAGK